ncbi:Pde4d, partial [Symbiodinium necroappetens]
AQHFQSVKKVQMFYEMNSEVLQMAGDVYREQVEEDEEEPVFPLPEVTDVFKDTNNKQILVNLL